MVLCTDITSQNTCITTCKCVWVLSLEACHSATCDHVHNQDDVVQDFGCLQYNYFLIYLLGSAASALLAVMVVYVGKLFMLRWRKPLHHFPIMITSCGLACILVIDVLWFQTKFWLTTGLIAFFLTYACLTVLSVLMVPVEQYWHMNRRVFALRWTRWGVPVAWLCVVIGVYLYLDFQKMLNHFQATDVAMLVMTAVLFVPMIMNRLEQARNKARFMSVFVLAFMVGFMICEGLFKLYEDGVGKLPLVLKTVIHLVFFHLAFDLTHHMLMKRLRRIPSNRLSEEDGLRPASWSPDFGSPDAVQGTPLHRSDSMPVIKSTWWCCFRTQEEVPKLFRRSSYQSLAQLTNPISAV